MGFLSKDLAKIYGNEFKWTENVAQNIFERRRDFQNITLFAVVETDMGQNSLPEDYEKLAPVSDLIPDTHEVI